MTSCPEAMTVAPLLVLGVGNPSRGDDALGSTFIERLGELLAPEVESGAVELLTDFQLQIEHALDLVGRTRVVFVDASVRAAPPFEHARVAAKRDASCSTHALSPEAVLDTHRMIAGEPPESWVLAIRGERFELGEPLTQRAQAHLDAALEFFVADARGRLDASAGRRIEVEGTVQGVGFRPWVYRVATRLELRGEVRNTARGACIEAWGSPRALDALVRAIQAEPPAAASVRSVRVTALAHSEAVGFRIAPSEAPVAAATTSPSSAPARGEAAGPASVLALPPDLASCADCLREVADPRDRHHGYVFTSCMACGPRLSIARALPYDRATTTMAGLPPCPACRAEYESPADRRFHAQTLACPACGPRLWLADARGRELAASDPIEAAVALLADRKIIGVQGLGAFHLVCDARDGAAVAELRRRKGREQQPFAVMVPDLAAAHAVAELDAAAVEALTSAARPIVLAPERPGVLPAEVNGPSRRTGVMLPYTPLHQRLLSAAARPLVVTSGNPSGGPAIIASAEACARLASSVDAFLLHDRPIERRVEDSVVARSATGMRVVRRARGFAPRPIQLPVAAREPVLAVGGHLKNSACLVVGDLAYLTPHLGDLELEESVAAWRRDVEGFERLLGVRAEVLAHDLHPEYATTRFALERPARRRVGVQHHAAHVLAAIAELHLTEPVLGIVFDGSGWGPDGSAWGAEFLIVDAGRWARASTFRPLWLPGGERAIREVWRVALAALCDALGPAEAIAVAPRLGLFDGLPSGALGSVARMIDARVSGVPARGMGRWFDAVGALVLGLPRAGFEGHVAIALEELAAAHDVEPYALGLPDSIAIDEPIGAGHEVDLRPTVRAVVADLLEGVSRATIAARFHRSIVEATSAVARRVLAATGLGRVVLSGGCFQNQRLERGLVERLGPERVSMARDVPVNDGGLALGQAWAAVLALETGVD
jgi:hydrogenase maturation protein HypF